MKNTSLSSVRRLAVTLLGGLLFAACSSTTEFEISGAAPALTSTEWVMGADQTAPTPGAGQWTVLAFFSPT